MTTPAMHVGFLGPGATGRAMAANPLASLLRDALLDTGGDEGGA